MKNLYNLISKVLDIDPDFINDETSPENVENWDSFNGLVLVTELEKEFNVKFSVEEIMSVKNVGDIKTALNRHGLEI